VAVKVLDSRGSGSYSGVIAGVDYVASVASAGDVANMSLGGPPSQALDDAVINAAAKGILFALAAGNNSNHSGNYSPSRVNAQGVYTVSAMDAANVFASFSNYGNPPVDFCAPGVAVKSTWKDGGYNTISGTSMASPHVAGVLLVTGGNPASDGFVTGDPDLVPDAVIHR
jgi:subtilisin family serine protease